ncbi:iron-containing alcohol dehydrogenase family protein [Musicola paradisiaca]|uniref:Iron-containing alcohol dehydrogenase n=1 Tax=Musicola paradisiaca (strain Ech703) TaxID=579405 RepID=C6CDI1_MUSP7|nr:iron-containing alcohol dehydrogenase family protein [Musicola paradisiaca]ACS85098.1 iron-containing alcohol dehydrogenase [Musicola paradisiaca Ech703]
MIAIKVPDTYLNQDGIIARVGDYIQPLAHRVLIVTSPRAWQAASEQVTASLERHGLHYRVLFLEGYCTRETVAALHEQALEERAELILGIGGGRVLDTAKAVGNHQASLPVITVPTIAATCAAWSPISVVYSAQGAHLGAITLQRLPVWVLVDSEVIARSPVRYLKAGIVDALAKWYEFQPYLRHGDDALALQIKAQVARLAVDVFDQYGEQALADNQRQRVTPALHKAIDGAIALAGVANSFRDDKPRLGVGHAIHNSLTHLPALQQWLHGEKVGFGLAVQAQLRRYGSPVTPQALGLQETDFATIVAQVKIPADVAARLPFAVDDNALQLALWATLP